MDRRYLTTIAMNYGGGPVGVETMAAALSEPRDAIEDIIEPYLIQCGYLQRTPRGRLLTSHAFRHLGISEPDLLNFLGSLAIRPGRDALDDLQEQCAWAMRALGYRSVATGASAAGRLWTGRPRAC